MRKKVTVMAFAAVAAFILALPVMAQTTYATLGTLQSNMKTSTAGIFNNDVDNYMNYHKYSDVAFDKWFGYVTGKVQGGGVLDLGYARNFGGIYLGAWYRGNFYKVSGAGNKESHVIAPLYDDSRETLLKTTETITYQQKWEESANQVEFLIGVAGHGIKLGFFESLASNQNGGSPERLKTITDYMDGRISYVNATSSYQDKQGYLKPYLGWGSNFKVGGMKLMPYIDVGLTIFNDSLTDNSRNYTTVNGVKQDIVEAINAGYSNGYMEPTGIIGAKVDLAKKGATQTTLELRYGIGMALYNNDAPGPGSSVKGTASWTDGSYVDQVTKYGDRTTTETAISVTANEQSRISHSITPIYKITGEPAEGFRLGFSAGVPVSFGSTSSKNYTTDYNFTRTDYNWDNPYTETKKITRANSDSSESSSLSAKLELSLGASYKLIPDRFTINAGIKATPVNFSHEVNKGLPNTISKTTTTTTSDGDGNSLTTKVIEPVTQSTTVAWADTWNTYEGTLSGGFTFNFTPWAALDMGVATSGTFQLNVTNVNVIFTFKF